MDKEVYCFGYSRKSPDDKENTEVSIRNQNDLIALTCKNKEWNLLSIEEDKDISGSDRTRKGILKQVFLSKKFKKENPKFDVYIIVKDSKRFMRDSAFFREILEDLNYHGVKVFSITKNSFLDFRDIGDRLMSVIDEQIIFDAEKYAELTEQLKISKGLPCIPAPFGYEYNKEKNWVINKKASKIITKVLSDYVNSIPYTSTIKETHLTKTKYYRILKNAKNGLYSGFVYYKKKNGEKVSYKGIHEAIISEEVFKKVNEKSK